MVEMQFDTDLQAHRTEEVQRTNLGYRMQHELRSTGSAYVETAPTCKIPSTLRDIYKCLFQQRTPNLHAVGAKQMTLHVSTYLPRYLQRVVALGVYIQREFSYRTILDEDVC